MGLVNKVVAPDETRCGGRRDVPAAAGREPAEPEDSEDEPELCDRLDAPAFTAGAEMLTLLYAPKNRARGRRPF